MTTPHDRIERALDCAQYGPFEQRKAALEDARLALAELRERDAKLAAAEPVAWVRTLNGGIDWSDDCFSETEDGSGITGREIADGYGARPLYALPPDGARVSDDDLRWLLEQAEAGINARVNVSPSIEWADYISHERERLAALGGDK